MARAVFAGDRAGVKSWLYRYQRDGKEHQMGLGSLSAVSLADARRNAAEARRLRAEGVDPIRARNASQVAKTPTTFKDCGEAYIAAHKAGWSSKSPQQWTTTFETCVYPTFGDSPIRDVDTHMVLQALEPIWRAKAVTASRVRGRIESVLDWAKVKPIEPATTRHGGAVISITCCRRYPKFAR
jgi:hypothetical protein